MDTALRFSEMAARAVSQLPSTTCFSQFNWGRKPDHYCSNGIRNLKPSCFRSRWMGSSLSILPASLRTQVVRKVPRVIATVSLSLPTAKPDRVSSTEKIPRWSRKAIKSFAMAELEARKLKYSTTGTEALPMGILIEGTSLAAKFLRANGITLFKVREETVKLLGKGDLYFFSPEHPPLTEEAQRVLDYVVDKKLKSGDGGEITTTDMLIGIWLEVDSPGHKIMATLGFNDEKAKELESSSTEPGYVDD